MTASCSRCGAELAEAARFCSACGAARRAHAQLQRARARDERRRDQRSVAAIAVLVAVPLVGAVVVLDAVAPESEFVAHGLFAGILLVAGLVASSILGPQAFADGLRRADGRFYMMAPAVALATFGVSVLYVLLLEALPALSEHVDPVIETDLVIEIVGALLVAPVLEEWACRGVAWTALRRLAGPRTTLVVTAAVFAILHGLGGGYALEFPHRFLAGLGFGWLRLRSGSVLPAMLAHFVHNALAILMA